MRCYENSLPENFEKIVKINLEKGYRMEALAYKNIRDSEKDKKITYLANDYNFLGFILYK